MPVKRRKAAHKRAALVGALLFFAAVSVGLVLLYTVCLPKKYADYVESAADEFSLESELLYAVMRAESSFDASAVSPAGAVGLMQIMPSVARHFEVPLDRVSDPETNVWLANKLMTEIMSTLRLPESISEKDRMSIVLASYNSGIGHVTDARRLARLHGENPNSWEVVARYLTLKAQPEYYEKNLISSISTDVSLFMVI